MNSTRLIHCTWVYPVLEYPPFFGYYFFNVMLVVLLLLHVFWAYLILRMVRKFLFGKVSPSWGLWPSSCLYVYSVLAFPEIQTYNKRNIRDQAV